MAAANLAEAHGLAAHVFRDAEAAANDAAAVRIEAPAKAGELLQGMAERGERKAWGTRCHSLLHRSATWVSAGWKRHAGSRSP